MFARLQFLLLVLVAALPALCQVAPQAEGGVTPPEDESQMMTPPPVSGVAYPNIATSDERHNYLSATLGGTVGYTDNVLPSSTAIPVSDYTYTFQPGIAYDRKTARQSTSISYNPVMTFYQPTSALDAVNHSANFNLQERLSPALAFAFLDTFVRTSDVFSVAYPFPGGITGNSQAAVSAAILPFAEQMTNNASAAVNYQFSANGMVGASASDQIYNYPNSTTNFGLYDSNTIGGSAFYDRRFAQTQYIGVNYQYAHTGASPTNQNIVTQTDTVLPFYTVYFNRQFSLSISGGGQYVSLTQLGQPGYSAWKPTGSVSLGWQGAFGGLAISYQRAVAPGQGLLGLYQDDSYAGSGVWKLARSWNVGASIAYYIVNSVAIPVGANYQGGNSLTAGGSIHHTFGERLSADLTYDRLHENYIGIAAIASNPDSDRVFATVTYQFTKLLGR